MCPLLGVSAQGGSTVMLLFCALSTLLTVALFFLTVENLCLCDCECKWSHSSWMYSVPSIYLFNNCDNRKERLDGKRIIKAHSTIY